MKERFYLSPDHLPVLKTADVSLLEGVIRVIHKPCGQSRGRGFPKKPCLSTWGKEGLHVDKPREQEISGENLF